MILYNYSQISIATYSCQLFVETLRKNKDRFEDFVFNLTTAHKMCSSTNNVVEKYEALYNDYISRKIEGGY